MTKRLSMGLCCLVGIVMAVAAAPPKGGENSDLYVLVEASPRVIMALQNNGSNISCVVLEEGLVFFDASLSTRVATRFRNEMEERFERPTLALVLTHAHLDHILGMGAFADVPVHAAAAGRPRWDHFVGLEWDERTVAGYASIFQRLPEEIPDAELRLPTAWFDDELVLGSGDDSIRVQRTGGHTVDSSSVVVGEEKVVIAGDLVQARRRPYFGETDTDFDAWIGAMLGWEELEIGAVCPGHGPVIDGAELGAIRGWFETAAAKMAEAKRDGATLEGVLGDSPLPAGYWPVEDTAPGWWAYCLKRLFDAS